MLSLETQAAMRRGLRTRLEIFPRWLPACLGAPVLGVVPTVITGYIDQSAPWNAPWAANDFVLVPLGSYIGGVFLLNLWLLPAVIAGRWALSGRRLTGARNTLGPSAIAMLLCVAGLVIGQALRRSGFHEPIVAQRLGALILQAICFVLAWNFLFSAPWRVHPPEPSAEEAPTSANPASRFASALALPMLTVLAWTGLGNSFLAGLLAWDRAELTYLESVESPYRPIHANVIQRDRPMRMVLGYEYDVVILPAGSTWTERRRGTLLLTTDGSILDLHWTAPDTLAVTISTAGEGREWTRSWQSEGISVRANYSPD